MQGKAFQMMNKHMKNRTLETGPKPFRSLAQYERDAAAAEEETCKHRAEHCKDMCNNAAMFDLFSVDGIAQEPGQSLNVFMFVEHARYHYLFMLIIVHLCLLCYLLRYFIPKP